MSGKANRPKANSICGEKGQSALQQRTGAQSHGSSTLRGVWCGAPDYGRMHRASAGATIKSDGCGVPDYGRIHQVAEGMALREFRAWMAKYEPVEKAILEERARREMSKRRRARERRRAFGDLCELTEGRAAFSRRLGISLDTAEDILSRRTPKGRGAAAGALLQIAWVGLNALRKVLTRRIDRAKHEVKRPFYCAEERARRQALAAERRKVKVRQTLNPCPTKEQILEAWTKVGESKEALLRFGSLMEDLECYVDNSLRRTEDGVIVGRRPGIKGWLQLEIPALYLKYKTVMAHKAAAKRMRQVLNMRDPVPLSSVLSPMTDGLNVLRARAVYLEVVKPVGEGKRRAAALLRRLRELTDPNAVEEANMLRGWRETYKNEITVRTKNEWGRRLRGTG